LTSRLFALDFFEFGWPNVPILDVFIGAGKSKVNFMRYLEDCEGYDEESHVDIQTVRALCFR